MNLRQVAYAVTTALTCVAFVGSAAANLLRLGSVPIDMAHLGYPDYFMTILGVWKVLGAIVVASPRLPRLKEWAYAGMVFDLTGAAASRASAGDGVATIVVPLVIAGVVLTSWAIRPPGRRLGGAPLLPAA